MCGTSKGVALIGMMGSGKSTVGAFLAEELGWRFIDLDSMIETMCSRSIAEIFVSQGESQFRHYETQCLHEIVASEGRHPVVLATGGGVIVAPENRALLHRYFQNVWLDGIDATLYGRCNDAGRPLVARGWADFQARSIARRTLYSDVANVRMDVDGRTVTEVGTAIENWLKEEECVDQRG